jgi:hypothetical protein
MPSLNGAASGFLHQPLSLGVAVLIVCCLNRPGATQDSPDALPEYVLKAGFLYNFAKYVDWPVDAFEKDDSPIIIGVAGKDPFGPGLEKTFRNKTVKNRGFAILRFPEPEDIRPCHMLFVTKSEKGHLPQILRQAAQWHVLTVGEEEGFARSGGVISILIENEKPKLEVNPEAADKAGLTINAKLLKAATIVRADK